MVCAILRDADLMKGSICIQCHVISMYSLIISGFKNIYLVLSTSTTKKRLNITRLLLYIWSKNLMMEPVGGGAFLLQDLPIKRISSNHMA